MSDRKVTVNENDLRVVLHYVPTLLEMSDRFRAVLDALGPEPCGHPSWRLVGPGGSSPLFRCVLPTGHHAVRYYDDGGLSCCGRSACDPIHSGDAHVPPEDVWAEEKP